MSKFDDFNKLLNEKQNELNKITDKLESNDKKKEKAKNEGITLADFDDVSHEELVARTNLSETIYSGFRSYVYSKLIVQIKDVNSYMEFMEPEADEYESMEEYNSAMRIRYMMLFEAIKKSVNEYKTAEVSLILADALIANEAELKKKTLEGYKSVAKSFFDGLKENEHFSDFMSKNKDLVFQHMTSCTFTDPDSTDEFFEKNKEYGLDLDELSIDEVNADYDYRDLEDLHPLNKEIDALKKESEDDPEYIGVLNDANDILVKGSKDARHSSDDVAEDFGNVINLKEYALIEQKMMKENPEIGELFKYSSSSFELKEATAENIKKVHEAYIDNSSLSLPQDYKNKIKNIFNKIMTNGIFNKDTYETEAQHKIYSLNKLISKKEALESAVLTGDKESIIGAVKDYRNTEEIYDELLNDVKNLSENENMTGNISCAREEDVPKKYRDNHIDVSRLSGLWQIIGFLNEYKIDTDEFLNDPFGEIDRKLDELSEDTRLAKILNEDDLGTIWNKVTERTGILPSKSNLFIFSLNRVLEPLIRLIPDDDLRTKFNTELYARNATQYTMVFKNDSLFDYDRASDPKEKMLNIAITEKEDRDPRRITSGYIDELSGEETVFDRNEYIKSHKNFESIILRSYNSRNSLYDNYPDEEWSRTAYDAVTESVGLVNKLCENKTSLINDAIERFNSNRPFKRTMIENLESVSLFKKVSQNGLDNDSIADAVTVYKDLKEKYSHRSVFAKIFYRNVRQQSSILDEYMTAFKNSGYDENKVKDIMDGRFHPENEANNMEEPVRKVNLDLAVNEKDPEDDFYQENDLNKDLEKVNNDLNIGK